MPFALLTMTAFTTSPFLTAPPGVADLTEAIITLLAITLGTTTTALGYLYIKSNEDIDDYTEEENSENK